jgi:hypothetical protein
LIGTKSVNLGIRPSNLAYETGFVRRRMGTPLPKRKSCTNLAIKSSVIWGMLGQEFKLEEAIQGGKAQGNKQIIHGLWEQFGAQATSIAGGEWTQAIASGAPATGKTNAEIEPRNSR